jgi:Toprim-like
MPTRKIDLVRYLADAGIQRLHEGRKEIAGMCPMHVKRTGHADTHPSWSINRTTYLHFCQSCHYSGTLNSLLVDLLGSAPEDLETVLNEQAFLRKMAEVRADPTETLAPVFNLTEWGLLNLLRDVPRRLLERRWLRREAVDAYQVRWDAETKQWVLPLRSIDGTLIGAQYRQSGSVLTLPPAVEKALTLFGYLQMAQYDSCVVVESPLDAVRLYGLGIPAVSTLGAWISSEQVRLLARTFTTVYMALDDDAAGHKGAEIATRGLRRQGAAVVSWSYHGLVDEDGRKAKDVGDVADDDLLLASWQHTRRCWL